MDSHGVPAYSWARCSTVPEQPSRASLLVALFAARSRPARPLAPHGCRRHVLPCPPRTAAGDASSTSCPARLPAVVVPSPSRATARGALAHFTR